MKVVIHELEPREVEITLPIYRWTPGYTDTGWRYPRWVRLDEQTNGRLRRTTVKCDGQNEWGVEVDPFTRICFATDLDDNDIDWEASSAEEFQQNLDKAIVFIEGLK